MIRSYLDETDNVLAADAERLRRVREAIAARGQRLLCLSGASARDTVARFVESPQGLAGTVTAIKNRYFGGNVDVTGSSSPATSWSSYRRTCRGLCSLCLSSCSTPTE